MSRIAIVTIQQPLTRNYFLILSAYVSYRPNTQQEHYVMRCNLQFHSLVRYFSHAESRKVIKVPFLLNSRNPSVFIWKKIIRLRKLQTADCIIEAKERSLLEQAMRNYWPDKFLICARARKVKKEMGDHIAVSLFKNQIGSLLLLGVFKLAHLN
jgi:hypothetical protein